MSDYDVLILGGGPAGSGAARLLAAWGQRVLLVDRPHAVDRTRAESIPPSARKVLAALGALTAIEEAGFSPWAGNVVWWSPGEAGRAPREEAFPAGVAGFQVERGRFDARLRALAAESGALVLEGVVRDVRIPGLGTAGADVAMPRAIVDVGDEPREVSAALVLDCSGRAGLVARQGLRRVESSHHTVALTGAWRAAADPPADVARTWVAAYADGWAWSVAPAPGSRHVTVMIDPRRTARARQAPALEVYREELAKVDAFQPLLASASLVRGPWGADASPYTAERFAGAGFLLVGDAGSFIDPLSSFGVKKALASAWLAAIAARTALVRPAMREAAFDFFDRRERAVYAAARKQAAAFAAEAGTGHPFWLARATSADDWDADTEVDPAALARDADVLAAFDDLRQRPSVRFRTGDAVQIRDRAAVRGREIVLEKHLFLPAWPGGVRYLRGVDLVSLMRLAPSHTDVGDLAEAFAGAHGPVALPDFLGALATLVAKGGLDVVKRERS